MALDFDSLSGLCDDPVCGHQVHGMKSPLGDAAVVSGTGFRCLSRKPLGGALCGCPMTIKGAFEESG